MVIILFVIEHLTFGKTWVNTHLQHNLISYSLFKYSPYISGSDRTIVNFSLKSGAEEETRDSLEYNYYGNSTGSKVIAHNTRGFVTPLNVGILYSINPIGGIFVSYNSHSDVEYYYKRKIYDNNYNIVKIELERTKGYYNSFTTGIGKNLFSIGFAIRAGYEQLHKEEEYSDIQSLMPIVSDTNGFTVGGLISKKTYHYKGNLEINYSSIRNELNLSPEVYILVPGEIPYYPFIDFEISLKSSHPYTFYTGLMIEQNSHTVSFDVFFSYVDTAKAYNKGFNIGWLYKAHPFVFKTNISFYTRDFYNNLHFTTSSTHINQKRWEILTGITYSL